jgi:hypothetical protein
MVSQQLLSEISAGKGEVLSKAGRRLPPSRGDNHPTLSCLLRWIQDGVLGPNGKRIRLEAARCGGRWLTTAAAIERFIAAQSPSISDEPTPAPRPAGKRQRASQRAAAQLEKIGI